MDSPYQLTIFLLLFSVNYSLESVGNQNNNLDWWQTAVFYQIFPKSFKDSDNDGYGDLKGIISKLDYLKDSGITATWLSPIFASPQVDGGYDISNYYEIDELYGTTKDFENLISKAKELGIKIILDFVPNHTSDQHDWFKLSENRTEGYEDFYVWRDGDPDYPPNNWLSEFKGSAWKWHEGRQQYYYHQFTEQQPDLNYSNPIVLQEMKNVLKFWLDKGVSGFRIDAVPYLFEDPEFKDSPLARGYTSCDTYPKCQVQIGYVKDLDQTYDVIYQFRDVVDQYVEDNKLNETVVLMTEAYTTPENVALYYGSSDGSKKGAHFSFNVNFISYVSYSNATIDEIIKAINKWLVYLPEGCTSNWLLGNHDNHRVATRFGKNNVDGFNMLIAFLPGVMITYNGEEIGMLDGEVTCSEGQDPSAINNCTTFSTTSRDFERTPFQWDNSTYAGFSTVRPWLPVASSKDWLNLQAQLGVKSHYNVYKQLLVFRKRFQKSCHIDEVSVVKINEAVLEIVRTRDEDEYIFLFNMGNAKETVTFIGRQLCYEVLVTSVSGSQKIGGIITNKLTLSPHESLIIKNTEICKANDASKVLFSFSLLIIFCLLRFIFSY